MITLWVPWRGSNLHFPAKELAELANAHFKGYPHLLRVVFKKNDQDDFEAGVEIEAGGAKPLTEQRIMSSSWWCQ